MRPHIKQELESLLYFYLNEGENMDQSRMYEIIIKELPNVKATWEPYKKFIDEARIIFEFRMKQIIERLPEPPHEY